MQNEKPKKQFEVKKGAVSKAAGETEMKNDNPNQHFNVKKEALGPNTNR